MKKYSTKIIFLALVSLLLLPAPTYAWGDGIPGALVKQSMETIAKNIEGTILGAIKTAAVTSIANQVDRLLGGTGIGQPRYIRNYDDYLRQEPMLEAEAHVYNFLSRTYRGVGSTSNYAGQEGAGKIQGNYATKIEKSVREGVINKNNYRYTLNEYCRDPERSLREGDLRCLDAWRTNPANNPYGAYLHAEYEYQSVLDEMRYQRQVMATSSGFRPNVDPRTGTIITPAGTIEAVYNDTKTLVNKIITGAQNPAELASGVVLALANRAINSIATKAAGAVESLVDKTVGKAVTEINRIAGDVGNVLRTADGYILTANGYITEAGYQAEQINKVRQNANSGTPAPPQPLVPCGAGYGGPCSQ